jgi:transcriptional activator of cad operon
MDQPRSTPFRLGPWRVDPACNQISRDGASIRLDSRVMRLLQCLASRPGAVLSIDELLDQAWPGIVVTPDSVYQAIASLRRSLGDDPRQPIYIVTVPRLGYRLVAEVGESGWVEASAPAAAIAPLPAPATGTHAPVERSARRRRGIRLALAGVAVLAVALACYVAMDPFGSGSSASEMCVAVLPFRDMTDAMDEEPFADGMTEQLIDALSKIPGSHIPSLTSSLYFKGKQPTIAEVAKKLAVAYVLDGSVRKSGNTLRITAQLTRADDGYVVWSHAYDRPTADILLVQSDIATQVQHALEASLRPPAANGSR